MTTATIYTDTIAANSTLQKLVTGSYFKILSATGAVNFDCPGAKLTGLIAGQGIEKQPFDRFELRDASGASNTVRYVVADEGFLDGIQGAVTIGQATTANSSSYTNAAATVTNASASLIAVNAARKYLLIQNKDASGSIYINFGAAATVANGIKIAPGGAYESDAVVSTQQIFAIGDIASNANIVTVQG